MARRGRKPAGISIDELEPTLRAEIERAVESRADESARLLFARFGLAQRGVGWASFVKWVGKLRREAKGERIEQRLLAQDTDATETQLIARLRRRVLIEANARAEAGDTKAYELIGLWSRIQDHDRVEIQRAADQRAAEKHEEWKRVAQAAVRSELDKQEAAGKKDFSREDVADLVDKIMRGQT